MGSVHYIGCTGPPSSRAWSRVVCPSCGLVQLLETCRHATVYGMPGARQALTVCKSRFHVTWKHTVWHMTCGCGKADPEACHVAHGTFQGVVS